MDIATLGLEVRSEPVAKGAADLDKLTNAAKRAEAAASGVSATTKNASAAAVSLSASAGKAAAALNAEATAAQKAANAMRVRANAVNDNVNRMSGSMSGLAAQWQDTFVTAAAGMSPLMIGLQQGTQVAGQMEAAMQGGASAVDVLGSSFKSLLSPVSFASIALVALAAAGFQLVDWTSVGATLLRSLADALEMVAPYATAAAAALALIYAPSVVVGLVHVIALISRMSLAALSAAGSFTAAWLAATGPIGWLIAGIAAVGTATYLLRDQIKSAIGVDVFSIIKDVGNFVINSFEVVYSDIKFMWANFPDIFAAAVAGAVDWVSSGIKKMVDAATEGINTLIRGVNDLMAMVGADKAAELFGFSGKIPEITPWGGFAPWDDGGARDRLSKANERQTAEYERIMGQDRLGDFGTAIANGASAASAKLRELAGSLGETEKAKKRAKTEAEKLAEKYNDILLDAEGFIASQMAERDALLLTEEAANALRYEQELLNKAMQAGITIDAAKAAELKSYAAAMAGAEAETSRFREALNFAKDLTKGFVSDLRSGLEQGKGFFRSFADAALNALDKVVDKLLNEVIDALFRVNNAAGGMGGGGGLFGFLGGLFGGGVSPTSSLWRPNTTAGAFFTSGFSGGGYTGPGAASNPAGIVHAGEYVFSKQATDRLGVGYLDSLHNAAKGYMAGGLVSRMYAPANANLRGYQTGGFVPVPQFRGNAAAAQAPREVNFNMHVSVSGNGDKELEARLQKATEIQMNEALRSYDREVLPARVNQIANDPHAVG